MPQEPSKASDTHWRSIPRTAKLAVAIMLVLIIAGISFYEGMKYQASLEAPPASHQ